MIFPKTVQNHIGNKSIKQIKRDFEFYKNLGYNDAAATTLAIFTYGERHQSKRQFYYNAGNPDNWHIEFMLEKYNEQNEIQSFPQFIYQLFNSSNYDEQYETFKLEREKSIRELDQPEYYFGTNSNIRPMSLLSNMAYSKKEKTMKVSSAYCVTSECESHYSSCSQNTPLPTSYKGMIEGNDIVNIRQDIRTDSYAHIEEKGFQKAITTPTSTFRTTYNTAAMSIILSNKHIIPDMVRTEEMLNYLKYDLNQPKDKMFEITTELVKKDDEAILFCGIQGKKIIPTKQNVVLLLDVSGSMYNNNDVTQKAIMTILSKLHDGDIISLVTYSNEDAIVLDSEVFDTKTSIDKFITKLMTEVIIGGYTNGSAGINKAYDIIDANKIEDGVNRVILLTDGDLNFGIKSVGGLTQLIKEKKSVGAFLSVIGTGIYNLQDDKLEALAKNGNGNYFVCNNDRDVQKCILEKYESLVYPIAVDVKAQVEFNPKYVDEWELIGYENRTLNHDDFTNDKVIAEPFGSGSYAIAMYRLKLNDGVIKQSGLKYQESVIKDSNEIATISIRYKNIGETKSEELSTPILFEFTETHDNADKAYECYQRAELLRHPEKVQTLLQFIEENS